MSQISKCPNMRVVLTYWEALRDVSEQKVYFISVIVPRGMVSGPIGRAVSFDRKWLQHDIAVVSYCMTLYCI